MDQIEHLRDLVKERYPGKKRMVQFEGQMSAGERVAASATQQDLGFSFTSDDGKQIFQARLNGFTFSRLRPYGKWIELRNEARRLWDIYAVHLKPNRITRVAVRYINQIDIPSSQIDYKDYFRTGPEVSPDLPQGLSRFFMQLQFPQNDFGGLLILTQTVVPPASLGTTSVILDIDVFKEIHEIQDEEVWDLLEILRTRKNEFFEGSLQNKTRDLFGPSMEY